MQKLIEGENTIQQSAEEIISQGYKNVFLITGEHLKESNFSFLKDSAVHRYIKQGSNVEEKEVNDACMRFQKSGADVILAIGGGSVIDLAKAIVYRGIESSSAIPFFIAAPTTAGSGSEATHFAVVYKEKKKFSRVHQALLPRLVILDPLLTYSLSSYQTAVSGMDALSQAIESWWNVHATNESKQYATEAIFLCRQYFLQAVTDPGLEARRKMLKAAHLAGKAINITRTTGPHALSYFLTANHNVPHGQAVALFLPVFFLYNDPPAELYSLLGVSNAEQAKEYIQQIMKQAGLATTLAELDINKESILEDLLNEVNEERFANNPAKFDREKLKNLINDYL